MRKQCNAFAVTTGDRCKRKALPGSKFCFLHIDKISLLLSVALGVIFSIAGSETWIRILPSEELRETQKVRKELKDFRDDMTPIAHLAENLSPGLDSLEAIGLLPQKVGELQTRIKELETQVQSASRGITENYFANGSIRKTDGPTVTIDKSLKTTYEQLKALAKENRFLELTILCKEQISIHPDWPTPYLFIGTALGNSGEIDEAIIQLEYFLEKAPASGSYGYKSYREQANEFIEILRNRKKTTQLR